MIALQGPVLMNISASAAKIAPKITGSDVANSAHQDERDRRDHGDARDEEQRLRAVSRPAGRPASRPTAHAEDRRDERRPGRGAMPARAWSKPRVSNRKVGTQTSIPPIANV